MQRKPTTQARAAYVYDDDVDVDDVVVIGVAADRNMTNFTQ